MSSTRPDALPRKKLRGRLKLRNVPREAEVATVIEMVIAATAVGTVDMAVAMIVLETKCTILGPGMEVEADITGE